MEWKNPWLLGFLVLLVAGVGFGMRWFAVGIPERDAGRRMAALAIGVPIFAASLTGAAYLLLTVPGWLGALAGIGLLVVACLLFYRIVGWILPRKIERQR